MDSSAAFPKSKQQRLHILLKDINQNRHRVQYILKRLADAEGDEHLPFTIKQLALEELLSEGQYLELNKTVLEDELDSSRIVDVIKGTKVGQGLKFLPRKLNDLVKSLQIWLKRDESMFETKLVLHSENFRGAMESLTRNIPALKRTIIYVNKIVRVIIHWNIL